MIALKERCAFLLIIALVAMNISINKAHAGSPETSTLHYKKQYTFTTNWFTKRIPSWERVLSVFKDKPNIKYLEIGAFEGRSALWLLENILTSKTSSITIIDAFEEDNYSTFSSNISLSGEANKFKILKGLSTEKIKQLDSDYFDFAYVDGSGKGIVMLSDLVNTWDLVKVGGIIICSNFDLNEDLRKELKLEPSDPGPHEAIDAFTKLYGPYLQILESDGNEVIVRKIRQ